MYAVQREDPIILDMLLKSPVASKDDERRNFWQMLCAVDDDDHNVFHYAAAAGALLALDHLNLAILNRVPERGLQQSVIPQGPGMCSPGKAGMSATDVRIKLLSHQAQTSMPLVMCHAACSHSQAMIDNLAAFNAPAEARPWADPEARNANLDREPDLPLICAAGMGDAQMVQHLLGFHARTGGALGDPTALGRNGETALHRAAAAQQVQCFEALMQAKDATDIVTGPAPAGWDSDEQRQLQRLWRGVSLMHAASLGDEAYVRRLLQLGAEVRRC
jgi:ankyrin repeat protein